MFKNKEKKNLVTYHIDITLTADFPAKEKPQLLAALSKLGLVQQEKLETPAASHLYLVGWANEQDHAKSLLVLQEELHKISVKYEDQFYAMLAIG